MRERPETCGQCEAFAREPGKRHAGACMESAHQEFGTGHWSYWCVADTTRAGQQLWCPWRGARDGYGW